MKKNEFIKKINDVTKWKYDLPGGLSPIPTIFIGKGKTDDGYRIMLTHNLMYPINYIEVKKGLFGKREDIRLTPDEAEQLAFYITAYKDDYLKDKYKNKFTFSKE